MILPFALHTALLRCFFHFPSMTHCVHCRCLVTFIDDLCQQQQWIDRRNATVCRSAGCPIHRQCYNNNNWADTPLCVQFTKIAIRSRFVIAPSHLDNCSQFSHYPLTVAADFCSRGQLGFLFSHTRTRHLLIAHLK